MVRPPASRLGPALPSERKAVQADSPIGDKYDTPIDRESAYETLEGKAEARAKEEAAEAKRIEREKAQTAKKKPTPTRRRTARKKDNVIVKEMKREGRLIMRRAMRNAVRGLLGGLMRR
jgi:hypothetical protein